MSKGHYDVWLEFVNGADGKEKLCRTLQYACKLVVALLGRTPKTNSYATLAKDVSTRLTGVEKTCSTGRKILRWGKVPVLLKQAVSSYQKTAGLICCLSLARDLSLAAFFGSDHVAFAGKIGLFPELNVPAWNRRVALFSLISLFARIFLDLIQLVEVKVKEREIAKSMRHELEKEDGGGNEDEQDGTEEHEQSERAKSQAASALARCKRETFQIYVKLVKNIADMPNAWYGTFLIANSPEGLFGLLGVVSSLLSIYQVYPTLYK